MSEELINYVGYMLKMWVDDCIYFKIVQDIYKCYIDYLPFWNRVQCYTDYLPCLKTQLFITKTIDIVLWNCVIKY